MAARRERWLDWLLLLLGAWLIVSPWVLAFSGGRGPAFWNTVIMGIAVAVFAIAVVSEAHRWEEWVSLIFGAWLLIAPFVLGFSSMTAAAWNSVILGIVIGVDAVWALVDMSRHRRHPVI